MRTKKTFSFHCQLNFIVGFWDTLLCQTVRLKPLVTRQISPCPVPDARKRAANNRRPAERHFIPFIVPIHELKLLFRQVGKIWRRIHLFINWIYSHDRFPERRGRHRRRPPLAHTQLITFYRARDAAVITLSPSVNAHNAFISFSLSRVMRRCCWSAVQRHYVCRARSTCYNNVPRCTLAGHA